MEKEKEKKRRKKKEGDGWENESSDKKSQGCIARIGIAALKVNEVPGTIPVGMEVGPRRSNADSVSSM